jgi:hypothetical protein
LATCILTAKKITSEQYRQMLKEVCNAPLINAILFEYIMSVDISFIALAGDGDVFEFFAVIILSMPESMRRPTVIVT